MTPIERLQLADGRRRTFRDSSRPYWLALQVGDIFHWLGQRLGVLYVGPIVLRGDVFDRQVVTVHLATGGIDTGWCTGPARGRLHGDVEVATPERAAQARAAWIERQAADRAELDGLRAQVAA